MLHSFKIHEPQCIKLWEDREKLKPLKERKPCPRDPLREMIREKEKLGKALNLRSRETLDELNKASAEAHNGTLEACQHCDRTFANGALAKHQKSCTRANPWKKLGYSDSNYPSNSNKTAANIKKPVPKFNVRIEKSMTAQFSVPPKKVAAPAWKKKSEDFRASIRRARAVSKAENKLKETGRGTIDDYLPPDFHAQAALEYARATADFVECPTCARTFSPEVAERHIPACAKVIAKATRLLKGDGLGSSVVYHQKKPIFTDNVGINRGNLLPRHRRRSLRNSESEDKEALLRARLARRREAAPMDHFLGRNKEGSYQKKSG